MEGERNRSVPPLSAWARRMKGEKLAKDIRRHLFVTAPREDDLSKLDSILYIIGGIDGQNPIGHTMDIQGGVARILQKGGGEANILAIQSSSSRIS